MDREEPRRRYWAQVSNATIPEPLNTVMENLILGFAANLILTLLAIIPLWIIAYYHWRMDLANQRSIEISLQNQEQNARYEQNHTEMHDVFMKKNANYL